MARKKKVLLPLLLRVSLPKGVLALIVYLELLPKMRFVLGYLPLFLCLLSGLGRPPAKLIPARKEGELSTHINSTFICALVKQYCIPVVQIKYVICGSNVFLALHS